MEAVCSAVVFATTRCCILIKGCVLQPIHRAGLPKKATRFVVVAVTGVVHNFKENVPLKREVDCGKEILNIGVITSKGSHPILPFGSDVKIITAKTARFVIENTRFYPTKRLKS